MSSRRPPSTRARHEAEPTSFAAAGRPVLCCAIYTRQSVARGEQDLTSCDVQRERCEDYVRTMQYEGSVAVDERFDDLGVSGGSLERPALRRLLSWCVQGRVDVVVVTSLDRLARKMFGLGAAQRLAEASQRPAGDLAGRRRSAWAARRAREQGGREPGRVARRFAVASFGLAPSVLAPRFLASPGSLVERDLISERVRETKGCARARGRRAAARVPLGCEADPNTRQLVVDENLARRAFAALDARRTREPPTRSKASAQDQAQGMLRGLLR